MALCKKLGLTGLGDELKLPDLDLTSERIIDILIEHEWVENKSIILQEIILEHSIVPSGTMVLLLEQEVKHKGERWIIHKSDKDPFPSDPHAHNYEYALKLDLRTGDLYFNGKIKNRIKKKDLLSIRSKVSKDIVLQELMI